MTETPKEHKKKSTLLMYFAQYMDEHLIHGGDLLVKKEDKDHVVPPAIFMKKWFRTGRAIVMFLNTGTLQVKNRGTFTVLWRMLLSYTACYI